MEFDQNINALFVCDNASYGAPADQILNPVFDDPDVAIPPCLGKPKEGQMIGTKAERLSEISGRVCYDSLGKKESRTSEAYHKHIQEVGHGSVYEHPNVTVQITLDRKDDQINLLLSLLNRPGLCVYPTTKRGEFRVSLNFRSIMEWYTWSETFFAQRLGSSIRDAVRPLAQKIVGVNQIVAYSELACSIQLVPPVLQEEKWISMYLSGGRGFSHEMVRHGDRSAISQRSSRFCDENESPWIEHPLITKFCSESDIQMSKVDYFLRDMRAQTSNSCKEGYKYTVKALQDYLIEKGVDKTTARKQARGAARNDLGNGLFTEMIFSASVAQWHRIFKQRGSVFADAEIRRVAVLALAQIKEKSAFAKDFENIDLIPSPDGIGQVMSWRV